MRNILIISDSYGKYRIGDAVSLVEHEQTWPFLIAQNLDANSTITYDCENARRLVEAPEITKKYDRPDILILHLGIVDIYPRPLPPVIEFSSNIFLRIFRRLFGRFRRTIALVLGAPAWTSVEEIQKTLERIETMADKIWLIIPPNVIDRHNYLIPGANDSIRQLAEIYHEKEKNPDGRVSVIDMRGKLEEMGKDKYLSPRDSHYNVQGNDVLAKLIIDQLNSKNTK